MDFSDIYLQSLLLVVGLVIGLGAPLFLTSDQHKMLVRILGGLVIAAALTWLGYQFGSNQVPIQGVPPQPSNVLARYDFESEAIEPASLDGCNLSADDQYMDCVSMSDRLFWAEQGFTGEHSLGVRVELLPQMKRVYSTKFTVYPPSFSHVVAAKVYIPDEIKVSLVRLLARNFDGQVWSFGEVKVSEAGWLQLMLDVRGPEGAIPVDKVDIDFFLAPAHNQAETVELLIDDIELIFPGSEPFVQSP